jgi:hypothetical protein
MGRVYRLGAAPFQPTGGRTGSDCPQAAVSKGHFIGRNTRSRAMHGTLGPENRPSVQSSEPTKGERTRQRIMDLAEDSVMHKGFAATSIEELVEAAGITKSGFFYHFRDKDDLAKQLVARFIERDSELLEGAPASYPTTRCRASSSSSGCSQR